MAEDLALVMQAKGGDANAFRRLLSLHYPMIFRVSYRFLGHLQDAEDVAQEVCVALADKLSKFKGDSKFTTWLYRVVVNQCRDYQKKRTTDRARDTLYLDLEAMEAADAQDDHKKAAWLYTIIGDMGPPFTETAMLVLTEEISHAEVAEILGCKETTVSWRMHEVRKRLTLAMDGYHER